MSDFVNPVTARGFTGHEMVDDMGIIHMNGRIYDARIGRFLQADPFIQSAASTQSYNRYSYLLNNPLNATDPSGFFLKKLWNKIRPFVGIIVAAVMTYFCGPYCGQAGYAALTGAVSGAAGAAANGGDILRGAVTGMIAAAVFNGIGSQFNVPMAEGGANFWAAGVKGGAGHIFAHAMAGGVLSAMQGGKFGHGFVSAGLAKGFDANFNIESDAAGAFFAETAIAAVVGGTISEMTGGKFANGAVTAAFQHLFNEMKDRRSAAEQRSYVSTLREHLLESSGQFREMVKGMTPKEFAFYFGQSSDLGKTGVLMQLGKLEAVLSSDAYIDQMVDLLRTGVTEGTKAVLTGGMSEFNQKVVSFAVDFLFDATEASYKYEFSPNDWGVDCPTINSCGVYSPNKFYSYKELAPPALKGF